MIDVVPPRRAIRVLHVLNRMNRAGVETWLMHVLRRIDRDRFQMDFLVQTTEKSDFDDEITSLGSRILPCLTPHMPLRYGAGLRSVLQAEEYDVIHSHLHHFSGYVLLLGACCGVKKRIAHSHLDTAELEHTAPLGRRTYLSSSRKLIQKYATCGLAASRRAAESLFGPDFQSDSRWKILLYGSDLTGFAAQIDRNAARRRLGIPEDAIVIGHIGRFMPQKNHEFLLQIAQRISADEQNAWFVLAGDGPLRPEMEHKVADAGLSGRFVFAGVCSNIPEFVRTMDVFVFPSLYEGLGLVLIEAQAGGVPCVYSDVIPIEADVITPLVHRLPLSAGAEVWARCALECARATRPVAPSDAVKIVSDSPFNIDNTIAEIESIYAS